MFVQLFLLAVVGSQALGSHSADKTKLVTHLMKNYMKEVEPDDTPLKLGVSFICASLNEETHLLTSKLLEKYSWTDNRLTWKPEEHGGLTNLRMPAKMIWTPDVKLYTTQVESEVRDDVNVVVMNNGTILWMPLVLYKTYCSTPKHEDRSTTCKMQIGSWTYDATTLDLQVDGTGFDTYMYVDTCSHTIHDPKVKVESKLYPCCPEKYASMYIEFGVSRRH